MVEVLGHKGHSFRYLASGSPTWPEGLVGSPNALSVSVPALLHLRVAALELRFPAPPFQLHFPVLRPVCRLIQRSGIRTTRAKPS